jgi:large subunit ribosomal protein L24
VKNVTVHLSKDLISKYGIRRFPVRKGDMVRIVRGDAEKDDKLNVVGKEGKVIKVLKDDGKIVIENINIAKADGKMKPKKLDPSAVMLTKLSLEDKKRKERLVKLASLRNKVVEEEPETKLEVNKEEEHKPESPSQDEAGKNEKNEEGGVDDE